jgi:hypothetical protein
MATFRGEALHLALAVLLEIDLFLWRLVRLLAKCLPIF